MDSTQGFADAARGGPDALAKYLATLPKEAWEQAWQTVDAETIRNSPISVEGFLAYARLMMYNPADGRVIEPAAHHVDWVRAAIENSRLIILAPPESAKTTILSILFTGYIIGKNPASQSIIVSVSDDQAVNISATTASMIEGHPGWRKCFWDIVPDKKRGWGEGKGFFVRRRGDYEKWLQERGPRKDPTLIGMGYQNRAIIGKRVDGVFVVDDIMDENNSASDLELSRAKSIFRKTISSRPTQDGRMVVVGTPWRADDVYADAIATGLYKVFVTPAWTETRDDSGQSLKTSYWPSVWPIPRLEMKRIEVTPRDFEIMYLMNLKASEGTTLERRWLQPKVHHMSIDRLWPVYYGLDFAISSEDYQQKRGMRSYFALAKMAAAPFGLVLRGDGVRKQVSLEEAIQIVNSHASFDHPEAIYIETWGAGEVFLQQLRRELPGLNLRSWKDPADKTRRFLAMARHFQHGRVRISDEETEFLKVFEDEWVRYEPGNKSVTNDTLDAASLAIAAAGINVYSTYDEPPPVPETLPGGREPWGGAWGMPRTRFRG